MQAHARPQQTCWYPSRCKKLKNDGMPAQNDPKTCTRSGKKPQACPLATLSWSLTVGDLALGAELLGTPAHAVEDVVEGTCALPPRRGRGRVKGCIYTPFALARRPRSQRSLSTARALALPPAAETEVVQNLRVEARLTSHWALHHSKYSARDTCLQPHGGSACGLA